MECAQNSLVNAGRRPGSDVQRAEGVTTFRWARRLARDDDGLWEGIVQLQGILLHVFEFQEVSYFSQTVAQGKTRGGFNKSLAQPGLAKLETPEKGTRRLVSN